ncbi:MAG: sialate O-acetylesterase [Planctomycetaceae bacterium]|nr:sialate O-acetylesterase [Planctomycetaceae bacterium]
MVLAWTVVAILIGTGTGHAAAVVQDDESVSGAKDQSQPVQVFILLGQSNMLGFGKIAGDQDGSLEYAVKNKGKYSYLVNEAGEWAQRSEVRNVRVMVGRGGGMGVHQNEWLTISGKNIGPEIGIGHYLGDAIDAPVLLLKSCIGNRSLGWDLLPPGSESYEFDVTDPKTGETKRFNYAGYKQSPLKWEVGTEPVPIEWYAGKQYDDDIANAKQVLAELDKYYPGATQYEIAGFFWWQGDKDRYDVGHASRYEQNLVRLIEQLRADFNAPHAKFVCATLGQTKHGETGNDGLILDAQLAVDGNAGKYPQFKGNVATVYANPLSLGGASNGHYNGNAETYMNVGEAMGQAMIELLGLKKLSLQHRD